MSAPKFLRRRAGPPPESACLRRAPVASATGRLEIAPGVARYSTVKAGPHAAARTARVLQIAAVAALERR